MHHCDLGALEFEGVTHDPGVRKRVLIRNGTVPHLTNFSQAELEAGQSVSHHSHVDMYEVFLVQSGEGVLTVDGVEIKLGPGVCLVVEPGELHFITHSGGSATLVLTYFGIA